MTKNVLYQAHIFLLIYSMAFSNEILIIRNGPGHTYVMSLSIETSFISGLRLIPQSLLNNIRKSLMHVREMPLRSFKLFSLTFHRVQTLHVIGGLELNDQHATVLSCTTSMPRYWAARPACHGIELQDLHATVLSSKTCMPRYWAPRPACHGIELQDQHATVLSSKICMQRCWAPRSACHGVELQDQHATVLSSNTSMPRY